MNEVTDPQTTNHVLDFLDFIRHAYRRLQLRKRVNLNRVRVFSISLTLYTRDIFLSLFRFMLMK